MNERYIKWYTPYLSREFEMLAFGNGGGLPLILFPTSFGSYYQNKDFGLVGSVSGYVDQADEMTHGIGMTKGDIGGVIGVTGATCCHTICRPCD
jgi:esterase/lipase superfamily enzyme